MACPAADKRGTRTSPRLARRPATVQGARQNAARRCVREAPKFQLPNRLRVADTAAPADRIFIATGWDRRRHRSFGHAAYAPSRRPRDWPPRRQSRRQRQRLQRRAPWADAAQGPSHWHGRSRPRSPRCSSAPPAAPRPGATRQAQARGSTGPSTEISPLLAYHSPGPSPSPRLCPRRWPIRRTGSQSLCIAPQLYKGALTWRRRSRNEDASHLQQPHESGPAAAGARTRLRQRRGLSAAVLPVTGTAGVPAACRGVLSGRCFQGVGWPRLAGPAPAGGCSAS
jgi:hypothetical protein